MAKTQQDGPRGRGAAGNPGNRFERVYGIDDGDGYDPLAPEERIAPRTQFLRDASKSILAKNDSPDIGFDYGLNPYRGCEHGCCYSYARPTHEYLGMSAGLDFESRILVKEDAPALLEQALRKPSWVPQPIILSGVTDCYQPVERRLELTRRCLEVLARFRNPVAIITKNHLVTRDLDVLARLAEHQAVTVTLSVTTLDESLAAALEPRASRPGRRLAAVRELADAGIPVGINMAPIIPGLTDHEIPALLQAAAQAGAHYAHFVMLRLPLAVAPLFADWLERHYPDRKSKVLNRLKSMHGGEVYRAAWSTRMKGEGEHARQIERLFNAARRRAGLAEHGPELSAAAFQPPGPQQPDLFADAT